MSLTGWRANRQLNIRASADQVRMWVKAAARKSMTLSAWIRSVLDQASEPRE